MQPYIPSQDSAMDAWATNFATLITADPGSFGLTSIDAAQISGYTNAYHAAYLVAGMSGSIPKTPLNPATRTPVSIAAKDSAKGAMVPILREYAILINNSPAITDDQRRALGLTIKKQNQTAVPAPVTYPLLSLVATTPGVATCQFRDSNTPTVKAKPFGATALELYAAYAPTGTPTPELADYCGIATKSPFQLSMLGANAGKLVYLWARWITRKGLVGPFSSPLTFTCPTGGE